MIINKIQKHCGKDMRIEVKLVNHIPVPKSGKRIYTRSEIPIEF